MEFDLSNKKEVIKFKTYEGTEYMIECPDMDVYNTYEKELAKENADSFEAMISFLDKLGLPKNESMKIQPKHLRQLMEFVTGAKKN